MAKGQTNAGSPIIEVDSNLDLYSENPVQNKVVTEALDAKQDTLIQGSGITISNNTISVTDSDKYLKNDATANYAYAIGGTSNQNYAIGIGYSSNAIGTDGSIAIGRNSTASGSGSIAIGSGLLKRTTASSTNTVAIGDGAQANAAYAIQLGSGINNNSGTLQFRSYQLVDSSGTIVDERISSNIARVTDIPSAPEVDNATISVNENDQLQAEGVLNPRTDTALRIWEGSEYQWENGEATTWYYWKTDVTTLWQSGGSLPSSAAWNIAYGDDKFVAIALNSDQAAYSTDGINWTETTLPSSARWSSVAYGDGKFVAVAEYSSQVAYSTDGINWIETTLPPISESWSSVTYGDGKFVAVISSYSNKAAYSTDGINWTETTLPMYAGMGSVTYGDGKFVAVGQNRKEFIYSTDGINWTASTLPSSARWSSVAYGDGKFVTIAQDSTKAAYSTDGINWTASTLPSHAYWRSVAYGDGKFVTVAYDSNKSAYSTDGISWTASTISSSDSWYSVIYGDGKFVVVTNNSDSTAIFSMSYDKCYTLDQIPTVSTQVYSAPETLSDKTITSTGDGTITLSDSLTYNYTPGGNQNTYRTIGDAHPDWLCNIEGVGVKIGNTLIAEKNPESTVTIDSSITASSTNANAAGSKAVWDLVSALETRVAVLESQLAGVETQLADI